MEVEIIIPDQNNQNLSENCCSTNSEQIKQKSVVVHKQDDLPDEYDNYCPWG